MIGMFINELKVINDIRAHLSEITGNGSIEEIGNYLLAQELLNDLVDKILNDFKNKDLKTMPSIYW